MYLITMLSSSLEFTTSSPMWCPYYPLFHVFSSKYCSFDTSTSSYRAFPCNTADHNSILVVCCYYHYILCILVVVLIHVFMFITAFFASWIITSTFFENVTCSQFCLHYPFIFLCDFHLVSLLWWVKTLNATHKKH